MSNQKGNPKPTDSKKDSSAYDEAMKKQWSDTTQERAKYQAEHQEEIDRNLKAAEKARNEEDRERVKDGAD